MSGDCQNCGQHTLECRCVCQDVYEENIDAYITIRELEKLSQFVGFLRAHHYPSGEAVACKELGKIGILGGPTIRFHLKRCEIPIEAHKELLRDRPVP